jgi:hypothetical protein
MNAPVIAAYYYPGWHPDPQRNIRGASSEWSLLYDDVARAAYPDVRRPLYPFMEATVASLEAEARMASHGGIDAFLWCWYWDHGQLHLNHAMEMFLNCRLPSGFRYAVMWVNKRPHFNLPFTRPRRRREDRTRFVATDEADFSALIAHLIEHHWRRSAYLLIDGRPLLPVFSTEAIIRQLGIRRLRALLATGEQMARTAGFKGIHYVAIVHRPRSTRNRWLDRAGLGRWLGEGNLAKIGFRSASTYVFLPDWNGPAEQSFSSLIDRRASEWPALAQQCGVPFWPSVTPGWDARSRAVPLDPAPRAHPWAPVISNGDPREFERLLNMWRRYAATCAYDIPVLPVASWNEWTEGHAVAPCTRHGGALLEALRRFRQSFNNSPISPHPVPHRQPVFNETDPSPHNPSNKIHDKAPTVWETRRHAVDTPDDAVAKCAPSSNEPHGDACGTQRIQHQPDECANPTGDGRQPNHQARHDCRPQNDATDRL